VIEPFILAAIEARLTRARTLPSVRYRRFVVDGELPTRFGLRYWRFVFRLKV